MTKNILDPAAQQDAVDAIGALDPFLILRKRDNSLAVAARDENGVIHIGALRIVAYPNLQTWYLSNVRAADAASS